MSGSRTLGHIIRTVMRHYPRARRRIVSRFLSESLGRGYRDRMGDLMADSCVYGWSEDTVRAVKSGLLMLLECGLVEW